MEINTSAEVISQVLGDDGTVPNSRLPLLLYLGALGGSAAKPTADEVMELFARNRWSSAWVNGIFSYLHYHSNAHEVLGCLAGRAQVQFGGEKGITVEFKAGDVVVIPAGVAHRNLGHSADFEVVGAYPDGKENDLYYGQREERPQADHNIAKVPLPAHDPVYGSSGPLKEKWKPE